MSTPETQTSPTPTTPQEPITYDVSEFVEGDYKGFKFTVPSFNVLGAAIDKFGEAVVLSMLNGTIEARIRTKVKNALPKSLKPAELASKHSELLTKYPDSVLFSQDDAANWKPEARELSPNQLFKKAKEQFALATPEGIAEGTRLLQLMAKAMQG